MYFSVVFPLVDFRSLHRDNAGRLKRPAWGQTDPRAEFARGFGKIHTRTKSGAGYAGENYYADCDNVVKYPSQYFLKPIIGLQRPILAYPIYRRFYFDGRMAGRFELGFRLNEDSIHEIARSEGVASLSAETSKERLARLFYTQIRVLAYAHSFYLRQVASGKISGPKSLEPAIQALLERLSSLEPAEGDRTDELACHEMSEILRRTDLSPAQLATEIEQLVKPGILRRWFGGFFGYADINLVEADATV